MTVGGGRRGVDLKGGNRYMVTARARNFVGWSGFSNTTGFTTSKIYCYFQCNHIIIWTIAGMTRMWTPGY